MTPLPLHYHHSKCFNNHCPLGHFFLSHGSNSIAISIHSFIAFQLLCAPLTAHESTSLLTFRLSIDDVPCASVRTFRPREANPTGTTARRSCNKKRLARLSLNAKAWDAVLSKYLILWMMHFVTTSYVLDAAPSVARDQRQHRPLRAHDFRVGITFLYHSRAPMPDNRDASPAEMQHYLPTR